MGPQDRRPGAADHPLFSYLVASRPERGVRSAAAASVASVAFHGTVVLLTLLGTALASRASEHMPRVPTESVRLVDLAAPAAAGGPADGTTAARREERPAPSEDEVAAEAKRLLQLEPPSITPDEILPPTPTVMASLYQSEYSGIGEGSDLSAAAILADHHDATADQLAAAGPQFISYTDAPELTNRKEVEKALNRSYPGYLQENGVSGRVTLWFLIDEHGIVRKWFLKQSSGFRALDKAALKVAALMHFRPAINYDRPIAVWVALPVVFQMAAEG